MLDYLLPIKNGYMMGGGGGGGGGTRPLGYQSHGVGAIGLVLIFATLK